MEKPKRTGRRGPTERSPVAREWKTFNFRLEPELLSAIDEVAAEKHLSRNEYIRRVLKTTLKMAGKL